jgi:hypothetical protein
MEPSAPKANALIMNTTATISQAYRGFFSLFEYSVMRESLYFSQGTDPVAPRAHKIIAADSIRSLDMILVTRRPQPRSVARLGKDFGLGISAFRHSVRAELTPKYQSSTSVWGCGVGCAD